MKHNFQKVVRIGTREGMNIFAKIKYQDGKLSISGVEGPKSNGNCKGSAGQIIMTYKEYDPRGYASIQDITPAPGWDASTIKAFFDIWDKWHLNDMKAGCEHQHGEGWEPKDVTLYHYTLTPAALSEKNKAEKAAQDALIAGQPFTPTPAQTLFACLPYSITTPTSTAPEYYAPKKSIYPGDKGHTETKNTNWLKPEEHPDGILCKPCPVCGYKYGTAWKKVEIPESVHARLTRFPDTDIKPAWV